MSSKNKKICFGNFLLISSVCLTAGLSYWLVSESDDERLHYVFVKHDLLVVQGKRQEANKLLESVLSEEGEGSLDPLWLPLVRASGNGYVQLGYLIRVLAGDPNREKTYKEISNLIEFAPQSFHDGVKPRFLSDVNAIPGVRVEYLNKYELLAVDP